MFSPPGGNIPTARSHIIPADQKTLPTHLLQPARLLPAAGLGLALLALAPAARADSALFSFESPQFTPGAPTPFLFASPNSTVGPTFAALTASFTATPTAGAFTINNFPTNPAFAGFQLYDAMTTNAVLTVTLSLPTTALSFDFAQNSTPDSPTDFLRLFVNGTNTDVPAVNTSGPFGGGHISFSAPAPFTTFQLSAFSDAATQTQFALDNLTVIPEPGTYALILVGGAALLGLGRRFLRTARPA